MIAVTHFAVGGSEGTGDGGAVDFAQRAQRALMALAARPGYLRGTPGDGVIASPSDREPEA